MERLDEEEKYFRLQNDSVLQLDVSLDTSILSTNEPSLQEPEQSSMETEETEKQNQEEGNDNEARSVITTEIVYSFCVVWWE